MAGKDSPDEGAVAAAPDESAASEPRARVLVVEDEMLVALDLEAALRGLGYEVVGPYPRLDKAVAAARGEALDGAILDVNLNGQEVFPAADELAARGIPFLLATGYAAAVIPECYRDRPRLKKPFARRQVAEAVTALLARRRR
jgi:two-component system, response regulator PdtaR